MYLNQGQGNGTWSQGTRLNSQGMPLSPPQSHSMSQAQVYNFPHSGSSGSVVSQLSPTSMTPMEVGPTADNRRNPQSFSPLSPSSGSPFAFGNYRMRGISYDLGNDKDGGDACGNPACIDEECDPEECGDEKSPPNEDTHVCGVDKRPFLPVILFCATVLSDICLALVHYPLVQDLLASFQTVPVVLIAMDCLTLYCMMYALLCDPGQLQKSGKRNSKEASSDFGPLPKRSQKTWLYERPIRRYDHYCRWLANCVGLKNHREFIIMLVGLVSAPFLGGVLDVILIVNCYNQHRLGVMTIIGLHVIYAVIIVYFAGPILRIHAGFVSRNELNAEWKRNDFQVVREAGVKTSVNDLDDDDYNRLFDEFVYDPTQNEFDKGCATNCFMFWCQSRWSKNQLGEF